jgi:hypothetical protein
MAERYTDRRRKSEEEQSVIQACMGVRGLSCGRYKKRSNLQLIDELVMLWSLRGGFSWDAMPSAATPNLPCCRRRHEGYQHRLQGQLIESGTYSRRASHAYPILS